MKVCLFFCVGIQSHVRFIGGGGGGREILEGLRMEESCSVTVTKGSIPRFERKPSEAASDLYFQSKNGRKKLAKAAPWALAAISFS